MINSSGKDSSYYMSLKFNLSLNDVPIKSIVILYVIHIMYLFLIALFSQIILPISKILNFIIAYI